MINTSNLTNAHKLRAVREDDTGRVGNLTGWVPGFIYAQFPNGNGKSEKLNSATVSFLTSNNHRQIQSNQGGCGCGG